jgi:inosose dehydratase
MNVKISSAPCSFGVWETNIEEGVHPEPAQFTRLVRECGYEGTELGPPGYLGSGETVARLLQEADLHLAGSFMMFRLSHADKFHEDVAALDGALAELRLAAGDGDLPIVLLADAFGAEPDRMQYAGAIEGHPETWLSADRLKLLVANLERTAYRCRDLGFACSLHPDYGSYIETEREITSVFEAVEPGLLGLCFDTGNLAFAGSRPAELLRQYMPVVNHVHLKDVDLGLLAKVQDSGLGVEGAWGAGVFCELGSGDAQVAECLEELDRAGYEGWLVVEHERPLVESWALDDAVAAQRANRAWLADRGV